MFKEGAVCRTFQSKRRKDLVKVCSKIYKVSPWRELTRTNLCDGGSLVPAPPPRALTQSILRNRAQGEIYTLFSGQVLPISTPIAVPQLTHVNEELHLSRTKWGTQLTNLITSSQVYK